VSARILVVQHEPGDPPGWLGAWLRAEGCELDVCEAWREPLPATLTAPTRYAGLLVLGGAMDADADRKCPWLPRTRALIAQAAERGVPCLAICLGHQLAALALGGEVGRNPHGPAVGLRQVDWEPDILLDPLLAPIVGEDRAVHFNQDVVTRLPPGAVRLASTLDGEVQAARMAPTVWGLQFHPEVDRDLVAQWVREDDGMIAAAGAEPAEVLEAVGLAEPELAKTWRPLAAVFAAMVRGRAAACEHLDP
jgi:GMP synthase (glutamine-hydrolysing)